jgi:hypothetical protein
LVPITAADYDLDVSGSVSPFARPGLGPWPLGSLVRWLNDTDVPTPWNATRIRNGKPPKDALWKTASLRRILASPASLGATVKTDGTKVRDEAGVVVYRADALIERCLGARPGSPGDQSRCCSGQLLATDADRILRGLRKPHVRVVSEV